MRSTRHSVAITLALALASTAGCGADSECPSDAGPLCTACPSITGPAALQLGGGSEQTGFLEMQDGDEMPIVLGPTGLYMLMPSLRASGVYPGVAGRLGKPEDPAIEIEMFVDAEFVGTSELRRTGLYGTVESAEAFAIWTIFYPELGEITRLANQVITLRGEITDVCGNTATDELGVLAVLQDTSCARCWSLASVCDGGCDFEEQLSRTCPGSEMAWATALTECVCAECAAACEMSCSGVGSDAACGGCITAATSGACSAEYTDCLGGGGDGCLSCREFALLCRGGCDVGAVLPLVCEGDAATLATSLSTCVCAECPVACQLSCTSSGADVDCEACVDTAVLNTDDPCRDEYDACSSG